jgi:hypothetical protein
MDYYWNILNKENRIALLVKFINADAQDVKDMTWQEPRIIGSFKTNQPPVAIINQDGQEEWLFTSETRIGESHPGETRIYSSLDKGLTWIKKSSITSSANAARRWPESQIVQTLKRHLHCWKYKTNPHL